MFIAHTKDEVRSRLARERTAGRRIGLVPTMGALHDGHASLLEVLRDHCDVVAMWVFVNPTQFNSKEDFERYPRNLEQDAALARSIGVDLLFAPEVEEIYPAGLDAYYEGRSTRVYAGDRSRDFEGAWRPGHFDGVVHVITAFFNIMQPDVAVFGEKDYQQVQVVRQLVRDLHLPVEIVVAPIRRDETGLALSSRNQLLDPARETAARAISASLLRAVERVADGLVDAGEIERTLHRELEQADVRVEYVRVVDGESLEPLDAISGEARILVAAFVGNVRLIDNMAVRAPRSRRQ